MPLSMEMDASSSPIVVLKKDLEVSWRVSGLQIGRPDMGWGDNLPSFAKESSLTLSTHTW